MKYAIVCPDGASDWPLSELDLRTPIEVARMPNLAKMAGEGLVGTTRHAISDEQKGSDVCCMSLLGFDPARYHTGRAPLEAKSLGIELADDQVAVRCNLVTIEDDMMVDYSAGHITTAEARELIGALDAALGGQASGGRFFAGVQYRHLFVLSRPGGLKAECTPPHDILGQGVASYAPKGEDAGILACLMEASCGIFRDHPVNLARLKERKNPATQIWLWGHGRRPVLPSFRATFDLEGAVISAVDLMRSLGLYLGMEVLEVPGITGFTDTDYAAKGRAALEALERLDAVFIHVEAPDECGHLADWRNKTRSLEEIDEKIVGPLSGSPLAKAGGLRILVCPDHATPCALKTHTADPVPFLAWGPGIPAAGFGYSEREAKRSGIVVERGFELLPTFIQAQFRR